MIPQAALQALKDYLRCFNESKTLQMYFDFSLPIFLDYIYLMDFYSLS